MRPGEGPSSPGRCQSGCGMTFLTTQTSLTSRRQMQRSKLEARCCSGCLSPTSESFRTRRRKGGRRAEKEEGKKSPPSPPTNLELRGEKLKGASPAERRARRRLPPTTRTPGKGVGGGGGNGRADDTIDHKTGTVEAVVVPNTTTTQAVTRIRLPTLPPCHPRPGRG